MGHFYVPRLGACTVPSGEHFGRRARLQAASASAASFAPPSFIIFCLSGNMFIRGEKWRNMS